MQADIFHMQQHNSVHAELCNAIYERELALLTYANDDADRLRRKLRSLPFYVKKAAWWLIYTESPLVLDQQNASWQSNQRTKPPKQITATAMAKWIDLHVAPGLPLPVLVTNDEFVQVRLDSVDRVDYAGQRLHLNRWGWCSFSGETLSNESILLLKPTPTIVAAACAGHRWNEQGRLAPGALPLRELLLTALLSWPNFTKAKQPLQIG
ncbi:hypothetical protein [Aliidiomarina quisquiliarum]|uniref:hypothetical protein n=1 Tax=Aliidiomarina quisquiliarum TaxID=2938947 RepID=UPI00208E27CA|nr:hypothetical protein [Aliidiomarina quisquiliarum]MCO4320590.1 hypothetical protein [Aliidiomarina quisquiliarum]